MPDISTQDTESSVAGDKRATTLDDDAEMDSDAEAKCMNRGNHHPRHRLKSRVINIDLANLKEFCLGWNQKGQEGSWKAESS